MSDITLLLGISLWTLSEYLVYDRKREISDGTLWFVGNIKSVYQGIHKKHEFMHDLNRAQRNLKVYHAIISYSNVS